MDRSAVIRGLGKASLAELEAAYGARDESGLADPETCVAFAERALSLGEPLLAHDACRLGLQVQPGHLRLGQLQGLALARCGALDQASQLVEGLYQSGSRDEETLGILARVYKDRWLDARRTPGGKASLERSLELYSAAYRSGGGYWSGINAATMALASGDKELALELAGQVKAQCLPEEERSSSADLWRRATLGEAALLLGDLDGAHRWYALAEEAGAGYGDRASMRRNARLVLSATGADPSWLERALPTPTIAVFSGHRPDEDGRPLPRFPEAMVGDAARALRAMLEKEDVRIGYGSGASGGDILFHECMLDLGRETHVVLPEQPEQFARGSVATGHSPWLKRFHKVLERATSVVVHSSSTSGDIGYIYNNWMILGLARVRARQIEGRVRAFALWDGNEGLPGGTAAAVQDWQAFGEAVDWLAPASAAAAAWRSAPRGGVRTPVGRALGSQRIISMLFADAVGFSKLPDESIPAFVEHFLGTVARVLDGHPEGLLTRNTWGDGLYFSFASPRAAGLFALQLCEAIRATDWTRCGLPAGMSLRVALHCGPAHEVVDPVVRQRSFTGAHVSRAARIEPVTPPGSVYSSQSFAALCECEGIKEFACDYVGRMPLAKKYGEYPTFSVRRRR